MATGRAKRRGRIGCNQALGRNIANRHLIYVWQWRRSFGTADQKCLRRFLTMNEREAIDSSAYRGLFMKKVLLPIKGYTIKMQLVESIP